MTWRDDTSERTSMYAYETKESIENPNIENGEKLFFRVCFIFLVLFSAQNQVPPIDIKMG